MNVVFLSFLAYLTILIGLAVAYSARKPWERRGKLLNTPQCRIADAKSDSLVFVRGSVEAVDPTTIEAPLSGASVVWFEAKLEYYVGGKYGRWESLVQDTQGRVLRIKDESLASATIELTGAEIDLPEQSAELANLSPEAIARIGTWEKSCPGHGEPLLRGTLRYTERHIQHGQVFSVLGLASAVKEASTAYRTSGTELHISSQAEPALITQQPRDELLVSLTKLPKIAGILLAIGTTAALLLAFR